MSANSNRSRPELCQTIPERWVDVSNCGLLIPNTPFICLKTPIDEYTLRRNAVPYYQWFTISDAIRQHGPITHFICLTSSKLHYNIEAYIKETNAQSYLVLLKNDGVNSNVYNHFERCVNKAFEQTKQPRIAVHCTLGINETGFLVCKYMIKFLAFTPDDAINAFNNARGQEIDNIDYLNRLKNNNYEKKDVKTKENCTGKATIDYGPVPKRWLEYINSGTQMPDLPFVCFKTPLRESITRNCSKNVWFTPAMLFEMFPNLSLIINLTGTDRYYDHDELRNSTGVKLVWLQSMGHNIEHNSKLYNKFTQTIEEHLEENCDSALIGIHCTHGINRTGYLLCRYLIDRMGYSPADAIEEFAVARGHSIERENYINTLMEMRNTRKKFERAKTSKKFNREFLLQKTSPMYAEQRMQNFSLRQYDEQSGYKQSKTKWYNSKQKQVTNGQNY